MVVTWALIGVPLYTLAEYCGMGESPSALRRAGLPRALNKKADLGDVNLSPLTTDRVEGKVKNLKHFKESTYATYKAVRSVRAEGVIVLGGECSETVGVMAGLTNAFGGKPGMLWLDAHGDFNTPDTSPSGYIGGMCLAMASGRGPDLGLALPLTDERLVHIGSRALDPPEAEAFHSSQVMLVTSQRMKNTSATNIAKKAARHLNDVSDWAACHLDVDVVDPDIIPAVNYPTPGGLSLDEVAVIVKALSNTGKLKVLEVAAFNAAKDRDGSSAGKIVELVGKILS